jgi:hypothetical protein
MNLGESFVELSVASMLTKNSTSNPAVQNWRIIAPCLTPFKCGTCNKSAKQEQTNLVTLLGSVEQCGQMFHPLDLERGHGRWQEEAKASITS